MAPFSDALTSDEGGDRVGRDRGETEEIGLRGNRLLVGRTGPPGRQSTIYI